MRENFKCSGCNASLRYREQATTLLEVLGGRNRSVVELVASEPFRSLDIYEPGFKGPFRGLLGRLAGYVDSYYAHDPPRGQALDGLRCEDLEKLTFPDGSFDLVLSSDIFEHVRHPWVAFGEVGRVLRPGGLHVFTVPMNWPLPSITVSRVDVSGEKDAHVLPPVYHGSPHAIEPSLVYNDFGLDLPDRLREVGFRTVVHHGYRNNVVIVSTRT